jgi:calmodulin
MFENISKNKTKEYKKIFEMFDSNKDGFVNSEELSNIFKVLDINVSNEEIKEIIEENELEGNEQINFENFISIVNKREKDFDNEETIIKAFKVFDKEGNGLININELKSIFLNVGNNLSEAEINELLMEADSDMDGFINYEEFIRSLLSK